MGETFTIKLEINKFLFGFIVSTMNNYKYIKLQFITDAPNPATLNCDGLGAWIISNPGKWRFTEDEFQNIGHAVREHINFSFRANQNSKETVLVGDIIGG